MGNGQSGGSSYKYPDEYYYDQLRPRVRKALQETITTWSSRWAYQNVQKHGADYVIQKLQAADHGFMKKGWKLRNFEKNAPSPCIYANVKPLKANW